MACTTTEISRSGHAMTEVRVLLDRVYDMLPLRRQISFRRGLHLLCLLLLRGRKRFARWTVDYVQSVDRSGFMSGSLPRNATLSLESMAAEMKFRWPRWLWLLCTSALLVLISFSAREDGIFHVK